MEGDVLTNWRIMGAGDISIHSLRMEGDGTGLYRFQKRCNHFNPLPPHGGRRHRKDGITWQYHFNPLPPHGGRPACLSGNGTTMYFNPLPPHGGRRYLHKSGAEQSCISIHSLRMEGDAELVCKPSKNSLFQSTPSAWRETPPGWYLDG